MTTPRPIAGSFFRRALVATFVAHAVAMLGMLLFLMPLLPGGGSADDAARVNAIAAHPAAWRLGWGGWQVTALSDIALAAGLFLLTAPKTRARTYAVVGGLSTLLAVIPDQAGQILLVTRGYDLARDAATYHDPTDYLAFEAAIFPLTSGLAAVLYTFGAIGWALTLREVGIWSRWIARVTVPMLVLFVVISFGPLVPHGPSARLIGIGNALAFTVLELWFLLLFYSNATSATSVPR